MNFRFNCVEKMEWRFHSISKLVKQDGFTIVDVLSRSWDLRSRSYMNLWDRKTDLNPAKDNLTNALYSLVFTRKQISLDDLLVDIQASLVPLSSVVRDVPVGPCGLSVKPWAETKVNFSKVSTNMIQRFSTKCFINSIQTHLYSILVNGNLVQIQIQTGRVPRTHWPSWNWRIVLGT